MAQTGIEEITVDGTTDWFWEGNAVNALARHLALFGEAKLGLEKLGLAVLIVNAESQVSEWGLD